MWIALWRLLIPKSLHCSWFQSNQWLHLKIISMQASIYDFTFILHQWLLITSGLEPYMSISKDSYKLDKWIWAKADSDNLPQSQGHVGEWATQWRMNLIIKANLKKKVFTFYLDVDLDGKRNAFFEVFGFFIEVLAERTNWDPLLEWQKKKKPEKKNEKKKFWIGAGKMIWYWWIN